MHLPAHAFMESEGGKVTHVVEAGAADDVVEEGTAEAVVEEVTEAATVEDLTEVDVSELVEERVLETEDDVGTDVEE